MLMNGLAHNCFRGGIPDWIIHGGQKKTNISVRLVCVYMCVSVFLHVSLVLMESERWKVGRTDTWLHVTVVEWQAERWMTQRAYVCEYSEKLWINCHQINYLNPMYKHKWSLSTQKKKNQMIRGLPSSLK